MRYLSELQKEASEVRSFVKQNLNEEFISEVLDHKAQYIPLLLKAKTLPEEISKHFQSDEDAKFLFDQAVDANFTPAVSFLQSLTRFGDIYFLNVLKSFPNVPWDFSFGMQILNEGLMDSFVHLFESKPEFRKVEVAIRLVKSGVASKEIMELVVKDPAFVESLIKQINSGEADGYNSEFLSHFISTQSLVGLKFIPAMNLDLTKEAYEIVLSNVPREAKRTNHYSISRKEDERPSVVYHKNLEYLDEDLFRSIHVEQVPQGSKFRMKWIMRDVSDATSEEIVEILNSGRPHVGESVAKNIIKKSSVSTLSKANDLEIIENSVGATSLAKVVENDIPKALFLLEKLSSKFSPALRKVIPLDQIPKEKNTRKKSYFAEIFKAIEDSNIDELRSAASNGYNLATFAMDSHQSSKKRSCELVSMSSEFLMQLSKEELTDLSSTPFRFSVSSDDFKFPYSLNKEEALEIFSSEKFYVQSVFDAIPTVEGKVSFMESKKLSDEDISSLFLSKKEEIMADSKLFLTYLNRAKKMNTEFDSETLLALCKQMTSKEIKSFVKISTQERADIVDLKDKNGEFLFSDEEVLEVLVDRYALESSGFLKALIRRDRVLALKVAEAYLGGNKTMTELLGKPVKITRKEKDKFEALFAELSESSKKIVDDLFDVGGNLEDFEGKLLDWKTALKEHGEGRSVKVDHITQKGYGSKSVSPEDVVEIAPYVKVHVNHLELGHNWRESEIELDGLDTVASINSISTPNLKSDTLDSDIKTIKALIANFGISAPLQLGSSTSDEILVELLKSGIDFEGKEEFLNSIASGELSFESLSVEQIDYLANVKGLQITKKVVYAILENVSRHPEKVQWVANRLGNLKGFVLNDDDFDDESERLNVVKILKDSGATILPANEYNLFVITQEIEAQGINFEPVDISELSSKEKVYLIKFLENKVDPRFASLNLSSLNLDSVEQIGSFDSIKSVYSFDDKDLVTAFEIPSQVASNKKILKSLRDLISATGAGLSFKVQSLKNTVSKINPNIELVFSDFIDYSNQTSVEETESFRNISTDIMKVIDNHFSLEQNKVMILQGKQKAEVLRFLRSASEREDNYIRDTLQMIRNVVNGVDAYKERVKTLKETNGPQEEITQLEETIQSVLVRLDEVVVMDDVEHMHDRLVPLLGFIKNDATQPLGLDKFRGLEKSPKFFKENGFRLFFPRTRADLAYLGDNNGWCVNHHASYGDNVIKNGNILVGICQKGAISARENVIALAHYVHEGNGNYYLEQLRWSDKIAGKSNVDATDEFDNALILQYIKEHMESLKKEQK